MDVTRHTLDPTGSAADALGDGLTLPAEWYGDEAVLARERECIFRSSWVYAGPADRMDETSRLPGRIEAWGPFAFRNADHEAQPFAEMFPELAGVVAQSGVELASLELRRRRDWESPVNWKLAIENYLECYHCPTAHPDFSRVVDVDPDRYELRAFDRFSSQVAPVRAAALRGEAPYDPVGDVIQPQFHWVWPSTAFNIYPGRANLAVMTWTPVAARHTAGRTDHYFARDVPEESARELIEFSRTVGAEDVELVARVQRGLDSGLLPYGRLLPRSEHLIQHFQRLLYDAIA